MSVEMNYYEILEIAPTATEHEIKKAYRALSLRHHPDRPTGDEVKFKRISEAYETLGNAQKRQEYDRRMSHNDIDDVEQNIHDIFSTFFGGGPPGEHGGGGGTFGIRFGGPGGGPIHIFPPGGGIPPFFAQFMKPPVLKVAVEITLHDAYRGTTAPVHIQRAIINQGQRQFESEDLLIEIPAGADNDDRIQLTGKGNVVDGNRGDVQVFVQIANTTDFVRQGLNLHYKKQVSLKESLCGTSFDLTLLDGSSLTLQNTQVPTILYPGLQQICPGRGMRKEGQQGDLVVDFEVVFPKILTAEQRAGLAALL